MSQTRVALITGAAQGIGKAIALRLAEDGFAIALSDLKIKEEALDAAIKQIEEKGGRAIAIHSDVASESDVVAMIQTTVAKLGSLDVMVANAGIALLKPTAETTLLDFERVLSVNTKGVFLCYKHAALQMIKQGRGGRIVGACSLAGKKGLPNAVAYSASKFAVRGMTQACAQEWATHNITVNAYCPGVIDTPMSRSALQFDDETANDGPSPITTPAIGLPAEPPMAEPEVIASIVSYLVKPEAYFITGQSICIDGGVCFD